jgi:hypothetical protein
MEEAFRCFDFPAWRLPKGMIKASDEEIGKSIESCERWEWSGGGLVLFGVIATVVIAAVHPRYDSFLEQWGSALADGLVAAGVAIEIKFGQMAGLRQNELRRRSDEKAAAANERAENASLETERLKAQFSWRMLSSETIGKLRSALKASGPQSVEILYPSGDPESQSLAMLLRSIFRWSGWSVGITSALWMGDITFGLVVPPYLSTASFSVLLAFKEARIEFDSIFMSDWDSATIDADAPVFSTEQWPHIGRAQLYVGPKNPVFEPIKPATVASDVAPEMRRRWRLRLTEVGRPPPRQPPV